MKVIIILKCNYNRTFQVVDIIEMIFSLHPPTLHELLLCELFRKIDLREMKGSCLPVSNFNVENLLFLS